MELARAHAEEEVAVFEREGEVAQEAVMEEAAAVAADIAVGKMHAALPGRRWRWWRWNPHGDPARDPQRWGHGIARGSGQGGCQGHRA
jgi:hypothetical protein